MSFPSLGPRLLFGKVLPLLLATLWAVFRAPGNGRAPLIAVSGPVRLLIEALVLGTAVSLLALAGESGLAATLGLKLLLHYVADAPRAVGFLGWR